ncbi:unnamed protein product [Cuscuta campestris]|uniref:Pentatricopeptide repeat-containing protein n=1 Tax=Cuscuta campestris TaxID=132261 RepID=A0A484N828_9ASTE|nr:unnamed protein product [Cuscuta campestris]
MKEDFLAALLPLLCIFAVLSLSSGLFKWKDDNWKLYRGAYIFVIIGLLLLQLGAISAIIVTVHPWRIGATFLLVLLLLVLAINAIHYWASNNFYLKRVQMLVVCFLAFLVALAAFLVGWFQAIEGWGVVASLKIYPPSAGAAVSAITLVVAFGFALSRPCLTLEGIAPDVVTFVGLLTACSYTGKVKEAQDIFHSMLSKYLVEPETAHYACMVDLLGRAGRLTEAIDLAEKMPVVGDAVIWGSLLDFKAMGYAHGKALREGNVAAGREGEHRSPMRERKGPLPVFPVRLRVF